MSTTFAHLLAWSERLPHQSAEEALILRILIARQEAALREKIFLLISAISARENWTQHRFEATARWAEQIPMKDIEAAVAELAARAEGGSPDGGRDLLDDCIVEEPRNTARDPVPACIAPPPAVLQMYGHIQTLESNVAPTPGMTGGLQGVRIMRVVALMSKARKAQVSQRRISGLQVMYREI